MQHHIFITRADLTKFACDAWLLPTDACLNIEPSWAIAVKEPVSKAGWFERTGRVARGEPSQPGDPRALWLTDVGGDRATPLEWYVEGAEQFLAKAAAALGPQPLFGRYRPLLALPVVGTRQGGAEWQAGDVVTALLPRLQAAADRLEVDVALVAFSERTFSAAQSVRRQLVAAQGLPDWPLPSELRHQARRLGELAVDGRLVLFMGAGVSASAGLPGWGQLLVQLGSQARLTEAELGALAELDERDRAVLLESRMRTLGVELGEAVAKLLSAPWQSIVHTQLAALPVREAATTNYDTLFEEAVRGAHEEVAVLPYEPVSNTGRWLLKLHGCVTHPRDIVLTRSDYLRYNERRAALAGIVQALLVTRHMMFVGFGLRDENFHRIAHDVKTATRRAPAHVAAEPFGTALVVGDEPLLAELWRGDVDILPLQGQDAGKQAGPHHDNGPSVRRLQIFLDLLLHVASFSPLHLLDDRYDGVLSDSDRALRNAILRFHRDLPDAARQSETWPRVSEFLRSLGFATGHS